MTDGSGYLFGYRKGDGIPFALGKTTGVLFGATVGSAAGAATAHAAQKMLFGEASLGLDLAAATIGLVTGAMMGDALSERNHNKSYGLWCGLTMTILLPKLLHDLRTGEHVVGGVAPLHHLGEPALAHANPADPV